MNTRSGVATSTALTKGPRSILTIPSSDVGFAEYVNSASIRHAALDAAGFEQVLRRLLPRVVVRERSLSGEQPTWYVYRDGSWRPDATGPWWLEAGLPRVIVSDDGWITEANRPAAELLGLPAADKEHRHFTDFVFPGVGTEAAQLFELVRNGREIDTTVVLRPATGDAIAIAIHATLEDGAVVGTFRLANDVELPGGIQSNAVRPTTMYEPPTDVAFRAYTERALDRMSDMTPANLELRIRRLYPHAYVETGPDGWVVHRDRDDGVGDAKRWWLEPDVARVRYDAQALILEANPAATALFGRELVGHHWQEFVTAGSTDEVDVMLAILKEIGAAESRFRMPWPDGTLGEFDSYTEVEGDVLWSAYRRAAG